VIWHYRLDPPASGVDNMRTDQAAYSHFDPQTQLPLLRFYTWSEPTLSIGRFQTLGPELQQTLERLQVPVVRRPSGGQAILHGGDLTFSLVAPRTGLFQGSVQEVYATFAQGLVAALAEWGLAAAIPPQRLQAGAAHSPTPHCFQSLSPADLQLAAGKIVGSAQVRCRKALLLQTVIYQRVNRPLLQAIFGDEAEVLDLASLCARPPAEPELIAALLRGFSGALGITCVAAPGPHGFAVSARQCAQ